MWLFDGVDLSTNRLDTSSLVQFDPNIWCLCTLRPKSICFGLYFWSNFDCSNYRWISVSIMAFSNLPVIPSLGAVLGYAILSAIPFALLGYGTVVIREKFGSYSGFGLFRPSSSDRTDLAHSFPYYHGALFYRSPYIWQSASVFGVTFLTFLIPSQSVFSRKSYFFKTRFFEKQKISPDLFDNHISFQFCLWIYAFS